MAPQLILAGVLSLVAALVAANSQPMGFAAAADADSPSFLYTVAKEYDSLAWMHGADRFRSGATIFVSDAKGRHPLVPSFAASADPAVSFDGQRVLFPASADRKTRGRFGKLRWQAENRGALLSPPTIASVPFTCQKTGSCTRARPPGDS